MDSQSGETEGSQSAENQHFPAVKSNAPNKITGRKPAKKKTQPSKDAAYWEKRQFRVQRMIAYAGVLGLIIYGLQLWEMQKATEAATKAANAAEAGINKAEAGSHLDQRAWVSAMVSTEVPQVGKIFTVTVTAKNQGKTFARGLKVYSVVNAWEPNVIPDFNEGRKLEADTHPKGSVSVLPPSVDFTTVQEVNLPDFDVGKPEPLTQKALDKFVDKKLQFLAYGWLTYFDIFGCDHWMIYANELLPGDSPGTFKWRTYWTHNDADVNQCVE